VINCEVRRRVISNLKHILVGLELKAALITPHANREGGRPLLFESYFQMLIFEFCVGSFSVCECLGSIHFLGAQKCDGSDGPFINRAEWSAAFYETFDPNDENGLEASLGRVISVRDKLHQDRLGMRENIDWHEFGLEQAFNPARTVLNILLRHQIELVPETTNLING